MTNTFSAAPTAAARGRHRKKTASKVATYVVLIVCSLAVLFPFWLILTTSIKTPAEIVGNTFTLWPAKGLDFTSYKNLFDFSLSSITGNVFKSLLNTLLYVVPTTLVGLISAGLSAYAFAKINFKGKDALFSVLLLTMVMPGAVVLVPQFFLYSAIGWIRTPLPLIIPGLFGGAGTVFFLRQYMRGVPNELVEAAEVDGLGKFRVFWKIMLPVCVPAFVAQLVLNFIGGYNDYLGPIMFLSGRPEYYTLQVFLRNMASKNERAVQSMMATAVVALVPLIVIYLALQNFIIGGISVSAIKA